MTQTNRVLVLGENIKQTTHFTVTTHIYFLIFALLQATYCGALKLCS